METGPNRTIREPRRFVKKSLWVVGGGLPVVAASGSGPPATCNLQPATAKNFPALTSTVFSATFPPLEKENLRAFSCD